MDPVSVIGILGFGLHIGHRIYNLYDAARGAAEDVASLCSSAKSLTSSLELLRTTLANARNSEELVTSVRDYIVACEAGMRRLDKKLVKIQRLSSEPTALNLRLRLRYAFQEKTIAKLRAVIDRDLLGNIRLAMATLNL
jgi:hypothetical protein